jgi:hypothetical protein
VCRQQYFRARGSCGATRFYLAVLFCPSQSLLRYRDFRFLIHTLASILSLVFRAFKSIIDHVSRQHEELSGASLIAHSLIKMMHSANR